MPETPTRLTLRELLDAMVDDEGSCRENGGRLVGEAPVEGGERDSCSASVLIGKGASTARVGRGEGGPLDGSEAPLFAGASTPLSISRCLAPTLASVSIEEALGILARLLLLPVPPPLDRLNRTLGGLDVLVLREDSRVSSVSVSEPETTSTLDEVIDSAAIETQRSLRLARVPGEVR
jgi:hypothetical protein